MELYLDSANLDEIRTALSWGVIDGITTNPSLIKKEVDRLKAQGLSVSFEDHIKKLLLLAGEECPVSLEVVSTDFDGMVREGLVLFKKFNSLKNNVVVKIPVNPDVGSGNFSDGIRAIKFLEDQEIPVNATLIFTPEQALLAAKAGATYVSPFAGRVDDFLRSKLGRSFSKEDYYPAEGDAPSEDAEIVDDNGIVSGVDLVEKIVDLFEEHEIDCNVLAASIRNPRQVREVALVGADIATVPFSVLKGLFFHVKTVEGMKKFLEDVVPEYREVFSGVVNSSSGNPPGNL